MNSLVVIGAILISTCLSFSSSWVDLLYSATGSRDFVKLGRLSDFEVPCNDISETASVKCQKLYWIKNTNFQSVNHGRTKMLSIGLGVIAGSTELLCKSGEQITPIQSLTSNDGQASTSQGTLLYQTAHIPVDLCIGDILVLVNDYKFNAAGFIGWKSGNLVFGSSSLVSSYKAITDFFLSYLRAFLGVSSLVLLFFYRRRLNDREISNIWDKYGFGFLCIHFIANSSLIDLLIPKALGMGTTLLMTFGTSGCLMILIGMFRTNSRGNSSFAEARLARWCGLLFIAIGLAAYRFLGGKLYPDVQWLIASISILGSIKSGKVHHIIFSLLFNIDVFANKGWILGVPTNNTTHYLTVRFLFVSVLGLILDARHIRRIEEEQKKLQEQLRVNQEIAKFATQVAHDIRSPLAALQIASKNLRDVDNEVNLLIQNATHRIEFIANDLLQKHRNTKLLIDSHPNKQHSNSAISADVIQIVRQQIQEKRLIHEKVDFVFAADIDSKSGPLANCDPHTLDRVISNILNNACEALAETTNPKVTLECNRDKSSIVLVVTDNGPGFPPQVLKRLGEFGNTKGKSKGSGLGIAHAIEQISKFGGIITFENGRVVGARVTITLSAI